MIPLGNRLHGWPGLGKDTPRLHEQGKGILCGAPRTTQGARTGQYRQGYQASPRVVRTVHHHHGPLGITFRCSEVSLGNGHGLQNS